MMYVNYKVWADLYEMMIYLEVTIYMSTRTICRKAKDTRKQNL